MKKVTTQAISVAAFLSGALVSTGAFAADDSVCMWPKMKVLDREIPKLSLRKTSDGSKDEARPASFSYEHPNAGNDYLLIDAALRWEAIECQPAGTFRIAVIPLLEVHRSKLDINEVKKATAKLEAEIWWGQLRGDEPGDAVGDAWRPLVKVEYGETRDSVKKKNFSKAAISVGAVSNLPWYPGGWISWACDAKPKEGSDVPPLCPDRFRWLPSVGVEYYDNLPVERTGLPVVAKINTTFAFGRLALEWWPFLAGRGTDHPSSHVQLLLEYIYRSKIGGDSLPQGDVGLLTYGLTYYLDPDQTIGIGIEREDGAGTTRNFVDEERTTVALRVKF